MDSWKIIDSYFKNHLYPFTNHHLDSYRELLRTIIPNVIANSNPITMIKESDNDGFKIEIFMGGINNDKIYIDRPVLIENGVQRIITPADARLRNLTYQTNIYVDIDINITDVVDKKVHSFHFKSIPIGAIPIMLHSDACILHNQNKDVVRKLGECIYDKGGYFIIDGKEKVIVSQERITNNCIFINKLKDDKYSHKVSIRCIGKSSIHPKTINIYRYHTFRDVKSTAYKDDEDKKDKFGNFVKFKASKLIQNINITSIKAFKDAGAIFVKIPNVEGEIPLFIVFRALGITSDEDIINLMFANVDITEVEYNKYIEFIMPSIMYIDKIENSKERHPPIYLQSDAITYIQNRTAYKSNSEYTKGILLVDFMPNLETPDEKAKFLAYIIRELANVIFGVNEESDKDSYVYKRIDTSGALLADLFNDAYSNYVNQITSILNRQYNYGTALKNNNKDYGQFINENNIHKLISASYLTDVFLRSLKMKWGTSESEDVRVVQDLSRLSYIGYLSHLRRLNLPLDRTLKVYNPHRLHPHQFGFVCPYETPDGGSIGLLKNLAYLTRISAGTPEQDVIDALIFSRLVSKLENVFGENIMSKKMCKVFINGTWYGITTNPVKLYKLLRMFKLNCIINILISIAWNIHKNEIRILTESSRPVRPFIRLLSTEYTFTKYNWFELITGITETSIDEDIYTKSGFNLSDKLIIDKKISDELFSIELDKLIKTLEKTAAKIEYLDIEELDVNLIAMTSKDTENENNYTHLEIHPSLIMSVVSANIPFANHSFAARNIFHAAQSKQAISVYATNFVERFDTMSFVYHYPQKPLIGTRLAHYTNSDKMPNGFNIIIAVMSYSGYNQEDSLMINKAAIDRGFESLSYYKSVSLTAKVISINERTIFINPDILIQKGLIVKNYRKHTNYTHLNDEGFVKEGVYIPPSVDTAIIGMVLERTVTKEIRRGMFLDTERVIEYVDNSLITDNNLYGFVDKVFITKTVFDDGNQICKVRMLKIKKPELGDKHSSRHGQKGVIGRILNECDMPFSKKGIRPDIIMNAHAFPSRMTIGHIVECVFAKLCCMRGSYGDGTVFMDFDRDVIMDELQTHDYNKYGNEILYNGIDGKMIETDIFIGPVYYFRLKHMVAEKINARGTGPMQFLTRQPTEGRRKGGGLRIGEMERDALLGHGIGNFISESMMERSDNAQFPICNRCGILAITGKEAFYCKRCDEQDISMVKIPYTFKLLSQEMETMSLNMLFNINNPIELNIEDDIIPITHLVTKPVDNPITKPVDKPVNTKICKDNKILNPETNRCIDPNGAIAKKLRAKKLIVGGEIDSLDYETDPDYETDQDGEINSEDYETDPDDGINSHNSETDEDIVINSSDYENNKNIKYFNL